MTEEQRKLHLKKFHSSGTRARKGKEKMPWFLEHRQTGKLAVLVDVAVEDIGEGLPQEANDLIRTLNAISCVPGGNPKIAMYFPDLVAASFCCRKIIHHLQV